MDTDVLQGNQVAPAELEAHILARENVADCAFIQVHNERPGAVLKALDRQDAWRRGQGK